MLSVGYSRRDGEILPHLGTRLGSNRGAELGSVRALLALETASGSKQKLRQAKGEHMGSLPQGMAGFRFLVVIQM